MLQDLKASHETLEEKNQKKKKELSEVKERHASQTKELKESLQNKYANEIKEFQQSYINRFDSQLVQSKGQTIVSLSRSNSKDSFDQFTNIQTERTNHQKDNHLLLKDIKTL